MAKTSRPSHTPKGGVALLERTQLERTQLERTQSSESTRAPAMPSFMPSKSNGASAEMRPRTLSAEEMMIAESIGGASGMPTLMPPQGVGASATVTAWANDARVNALWSINQNRNAWLSVANVGWRKLANNSDTAVVALTMLAAHARETQSSYSYREEADGMIHECYIW
jgi:hypothetical protein